MYLDPSLIKKYKVVLPFFRSAVLRSSVLRSAVLGFLKPPPDLTNMGSKNQPRAVGSGDKISADVSSNPTLCCSGRSELIIMAGQLGPGTVPE